MYICIFFSSLLNIISAYPFSMFLAGEFLEFLSTHPSVVPAEEINYFDNKDNSYYFGHEWYLSKMPLSTANQITIEGSSKYFVDEQVLMFCEMSLNRNSETIVLALN